MCSMRQRLRQEARFKGTQNAEATPQAQGPHKDDTKTATAVKDEILEKHKEMQKSLSKVKWDEMEIKNSWCFKYLGSIFEAGGGCMTDV